MWLKKISVLYSYFKILPVEARLRELKGLLPRIGQRENSGSKIILIQAVADPYYLALFSAVLREMEKETEIYVELFVFRSIESELGAGVRALLKRTFPFVWLASGQWVRMYDGLASRVGYRSVSWAYPLEDVFGRIKAHATWKALANLTCLEALTISNVKCGDLIIDTYLRFRPAATVDLKDPFLRYLIWQAFRDVCRAKRYFERRRPAIFLSSYSTYIQHGVAVRVALASGTRVVTFGNRQQIGKMLGLGDFFHTKNPECYRKHFAQREDKEFLLRAAEVQLEARLSGDSDIATSYMASSAYLDSGVSCPDVTNAVIVYLHDFFDSPHIYPELVFPDFWTWICFTIETLQAAAIPFFLKCHPNQISQSEEVVLDLSSKYPNLPLIPSGVTTLQLVQGGIACVVTVYGTIAHEAAYLGIPSIACARHPHTAFDFCHTAKTLAEYDALLKRSNELRFDDYKIVKQQVLEFYAMHNLSLTEAETIAREKLMDLWRICHSNQSSGKEIAVATDALADDPGFGEFSRELLK